ncbi:RING-type domain-containing protein [Aphelenchoides fujianensis]|nr:RING-type domain-containing protein [Aphelenchoides fujianensis]
MTSRHRERSGAPKERSQGSSVIADNWLHCNSCYQVPSATKQMTFFFTSCGHVICAKCSKRDPTTNTPSRMETCRACKRRATFTEVNRHLARDQQQYFRHPKDIATEFLNTLKKVIEFQGYHRQRLHRHREDQIARTTKFAKAAQAEVLKLKEATRQAQAERDHFRAEAERAVAQAHQTEKKLAEARAEIERMNRQTQSRKRDHSGSRPPAANSGGPRPKHVIQTPTYMAEQRGGAGYPHLNGNTPISTISMNNVPLSTPLENGVNVFVNNESLRLEESPQVAACGGAPQHARPPRPRRPAVQAGQNERRQRILLQDLRPARAPPTPFSSLSIRLIVVISAPPAFSLLVGRRLCSVLFVYA